MATMDATPLKLILHFNALLKTSIKGQSSLDPKQTHEAPLLQSSDIDAHVKGWMYSLQWW